MQGHKTRTGFSLMTGPESDETTDLSDKLLRTDTRMTNEANVSRAMNLCFARTERIRLHN
jgi:hypothetical protein